MNFLKKLFKSTPLVTAPATSNTVTEEDINHAMQQLEKYKRTAYIPITEEREKQFSTLSKIGGLPYLRHAADWPECPNCQRKMALFLQLNSEQLPIKNHDGILQLFYCINQEKECEIELEAFFPFSKAVVTRMVSPTETLAKVEYQPYEVLKEMVIADWEAKEDYPSFEEFEQLGIEIPDEVFELLEETEFIQTLEGDKLLGWPYWIQSEEYPIDEETGQTMELLFQLDSEDNLDYMFGDSGIGHLTQKTASKPDQPVKMAFGWACC